MIKVKILQNKPVKLAVCKNNIVKVNICSSIAEREFIPSNYGKITQIGNVLRIE